MRNQRQVATLNLPSTSTVLSTLSTSTIKFAKRHPITVSYYLLGVLVALLAGGTALTGAQVKDYNRLMSTVDTSLEHEVSADYGRAYGAYYQSKGWFTCDRICKDNERRMKEKKLIMEEVRREGNQRVSDAKAVAGVFSEVGVGEARDSFWEYFQRGTKFAKRQR